MNPRRLIAAVLVSMLALSGCGSSDGPAESAVAESNASEVVTAESPAETAGLTASTVSGSQIDFASLEGTDTVLWFWAPW